MMLTNHSRGTELSCKGGCYSLFTCISEVCIVFFMRVCVLNDIFYEGRGAEISCVVVKSFIISKGKRDNEYLFI